MVGAGDEFFRDVFYELLFGMEGCACSGGKADALGYSKDVGIYGHGGFSPYYGEDDVGCFASYAWDGEE